MSIREGDAVPSLSGAYGGRRILVLGGLGFIGGAIARRAVDAGAEVHVVDALLPGSGGDVRSLWDLRREVEIEIADARHIEAYRDALEAAEVIFVATGGVGHRESLDRPFADFGATCAGLVSVLRECERNGFAPRIVLAGTRQVYGTTPEPPVSEDHPLAPADVNAVWSLSAEEMLFLYGRISGVEGVALRLTNVYGPGMPTGETRARDLVGVFFSEALEGGVLTVFGDGSLVRDFTYIDDVVEAFLLAGVAPDVTGEVWNVGGGARSTVKDLAAALTARCSATVEYRPLPPEYDRIAVGDYWTDHAAFTEATGWRPRIGLQDGVERTLASFQSASMMEGESTR